MGGKGTANLWETAHEDIAHEEKKESDFPVPCFVRARSDVGGEGADVEANVVVRAVVHALEAVHAITVVGESGRGGAKGTARLSVLVVVHTQVLPTGLTQPRLGPHRKDGKLAVQPIHAPYRT